MIDLLFILSLLNYKIKIQNMSEIIQAQPCPARSRKLTVLGFLIIALQIGMLFAYGFTGKFSYIGAIGTITNFSFIY